MNDPTNLPPSSLIPLREFLHDVRRSEQFFRDHYEDIAPRLPRVLYQGTSKFITREEGDRYKAALKRMAGVPVRGRPRKRDDVAAE